MLFPAFTTLPFYISPSGNIVEDEFDMFTPEQIAKLLKMRYTVKTYDCLSNEDECLIKPIVYLISQDDYSLYPLQLHRLCEIL